MFGPKQESRRFKPESRFLREALKFSSTARNALVVVAAAALAYALGKDAFVLTGEIEAGLPTPKYIYFLKRRTLYFCTNYLNQNFDYLSRFPSLSATYVDEDGETRTDDLSRMLSRLGGLSILLPLVAVMEHMAIAKAFSMDTCGRRNYRIIQSSPLCQVVYCCIFFYYLPACGEAYRSY